MMAVGVVDTLDLPGIGALSVSTAILVLVFRTLWRQDHTWRTLIDTEREASTDFRQDAAAARTDAKSAREEAAEARRQATLLRHELEAALKDADRAWKAHAREMSRVDRLVEALRDAGVPLPHDIH
jgi:uncharacterized protein (DUF3084 family)